MPEGPEVRIFADQLRSVLVGKTLLAVNFDSSSRYYASEIPHYLEFIQQLPTTITSVQSVGKKICFEFSNGTGAISSLGMEGKWCAAPGNASNLWLIYSNSPLETYHPDEWHKMIPHLIVDPKRVALYEGYPMYFDDTRHFGTFQLCLTSTRMKDGLGHLGPDLLENEIETEVWRAIFGNPRRKNVKIGSALLEQKYVSGIGNYLRAEILYAARINPFRTLGSLSNDEHERIRVEAHRIIREAYSSRGCSLWTYVDMNGQMGSYECVVYGRSNDPDGNPVTNQMLGTQRTIWWVPAVQI